jgi:hypothetical protein
MKNIFNKLVSAALTAALLFAAFPAVSAHAQDENPPESAPAGAERLEKVWARELKAYERIGKAFTDIEGSIAKIQARLDKAAENGKDVSALQAALDAYEAALLASKPIYDNLGGLVSAHAGFDVNGKVTDAEQARATVKEVGGQLKALKDSMGGAFKALREAIKTFRQANKPPETPKERDS